MDSGEKKNHNMSFTNPGFNLTWGMNIVPYVSSSNHIVYITVHPSKKGVHNISTKHLQILIKHPLPFWGTNSEAPNNAILIMYIK